MPDFHSLGDRALLINFEQEINPSINEEVMILARQLAADPPQGWLSQVPAYCSLAVHYDPLQTDYHRLVDHIENLSTIAREEDPAAAGRRLRIPVCYDPDFGPDIEDVCRLTGLDQASLIKRHTAQHYRVYMLGFLPGFPYLGLLPDALNCPRKERPRRRVEAGSVAIAGRQTGIYPVTAPGGWQVIGRTPLPVFDGQRDSPFLFQAGDQVRFHSIERVKFDEITEQVVSETFQWEQIYE